MTATKQWSSLKATKTNYGQWDLPDLCTFHSLQVQSSLNYILSESKEKWDKKIKSLFSVLSWSSSQYLDLLKLREDNPEISQLCNSLREESFTEGWDTLREGLRKHWAYKVAYMIYMMLQWQCQCGHSCFQVSKHNLRAHRSISLSLPSLRNRSMYSLLYRSCEWHCSSNILIVSLNASIAVLFIWISCVRKESFIICS